MLHVPPPSVRPNADMAAQPGQPCNCLIRHGLLTELMAEERRLWWERKITPFGSSQRVSQINA